MAVFDRIRERMRGQQPIGAAQQGMPMGMQIPDIRRQQDAGGMTESDLDRLTAPQRTEVAEARRLGEQMGAQSLLDIAGVSTGRRAEIQRGGRLMNPERLNRATVTLLKYKEGKASVERRIIAAQQWWKLKNWQQNRAERGTKGATLHPSNTGWLWNCIVGKHADMIDSYPEPIFLPRAQDDKEEADRLSKIIPVILEENGFEQVYNDCSWQKLQEGTGVYGVFWNPNKLNGLGDIDIKKVNCLNLIWESGVNDIEESKNVFFISYEDKEDLIAEYPELEGKLNGTKLTMKKYQTDDSVDTADKAIVVDWYYKKYSGGRTVLHYCKYVNETCLYSSEEKGLAEGYYEDGEYPFVMDALFPVEGSPAGYGYIDIGKDTQMDIDTLSQAMVKNAEVRATPRYFSRKDGGVNEEEFADVSKPIVHVNGSLGTDTLRAVEVNAMGADAHNMLQQKIDELKFITGNTDVNNGGVPSGVTAASAIAALKEDSGRSSKDTNKASYRAYRKLITKVTSRVRQFMDIPRQYRIIGADGEEEYVSFDNSGLKTQMIPNLPGEEPGMRLPVFDIEVRAQRENAYTKMSQNELALQFYNMGALNPQMTDQVLIMLEMMDFRGKDKLRKQIQEQGTLRETLMQVAQIAMALAQKYDPMAAEQLAGVVQGIAADAGMTQGGGGMSRMLTAPADNMSAPNPNENTIVRNARERAANASRPS